MSCFYARQGRRETVRIFRFYRRIVLASFLEETCPFVFPRVIDRLVGLRQNEDLEGTDLLQGPLRAGWWQGGMAGAEEEAALLPGDPG